MRFLLYNIRYGTGAHTAYHFPLPFTGFFRPTTRNMSRVTQFIRAQDPDIVGLVEMDAGSFRSGKQNQAERMAAELGHFHAYEHKYGSSWLAGRMPVLNQQANAFLTRDTMQQVTFHYFQKGIKKLVIELELEHLCIFLVHLSLKFRHRQVQLNDLYDLLQAVGKPCIVAGDFNAFWGQQEIAMFLRATRLRSANEQAEPTYPSRNPKRELDFILYSEGIKMQRFFIPRVRWSDHLPLVCDFGLEE